MDIQPIAHFESPLTSKFGIPRQSGLVDELTGRIVFEKPFRQSEAVRGMEDFDYLWLIWDFHLNRGTASESLTVRPPRLGGNERVGVFASRSPYRPNHLGLSSVQIASVDASAGESHVLGADLADGTPIYDIKPYVTYADCHPGARSGFVDGREWKPLEVRLPRELFPCFEPDSIDGLFEILSQDPRPQYQDDPERIYGLLYAGRNVKFRVKGDVLSVVGVEEL